MYLGFSPMGDSFFFLAILTNWNYRNWKYIVVIQTFLLVLKSLHQIAGFLVYFLPFWKCLAASILCDAIYVS